MSEYTEEKMGILLSNTETVPGKNITRIIGIAMGNTVRAKNIGKDIGAAFKNLVGGDPPHHTPMLSDARREAMNRMINDAKDMGADAVINIRFMTSAIMGGAAELFAYGTAVKLE